MQIIFIKILKINLFFLILRRLLRFRWEKILEFKIRNNMLYKGYIYVYINKSDGAKYVGQTCNLKQRHVAHLYKKTKTYFDNVLQKLGEDSFELKILEVFCCTNQQIRNKRLDDREIFWIEKLRSYWYDYPDSGYNLTKGGSSRKGFRKPNAKIYREDYSSKEEFEKARYQLRKEELKQYRETHREYFREKQREYRKNNPDKYKQYYEKYKNKLKENGITRTDEQKRKQAEARLRWRENHLEQYKEAQKKRGKEYYEKNKEKLKEYGRQWRLQNKEKCKEYDKQKYERRKQTKISIQ